MLIVIALTVIYLSTFARMIVELDPEKSVIIGEESLQLLTFILFWSGVYNDYEDESYFMSAYPFYLLLILLIFERITQIWIENRFGCTKKLIETF